MECVTGRGIARGWQQNEGEGRAALATLLRFYPSRQGVVKQAIAEAIAHHLMFQGERFFASQSELQVLRHAAWLQEHSHQKEEDQPRNQLFYCQDRMVHRGNGFAFTVSLHSDRIGNYESLTTTEENLKGWYTGDGMTYLYDKDDHQYHNWYPLVDKRFLPGTTTDGRTLPDYGGCRQYDDVKHDMRFVGGVSNGEIGLFGMDFYNHDNTLQAKKSYICFGDQILLLGSGIQSQSGEAFTTISNTQLHDLARTVVTVDGQAHSLNDTAIPVRQSFHWSQARDQVHGTTLSQCGVYLPFEQNLSLQMERRTGDWKDQFPENARYLASTKVEGNLLRATITQHLVNFTGSSSPEVDKDQRYAYLLMPNCTAVQLTRFAARPDWAWLSVSRALHAVYHHPAAPFLPLTGKPPVSVSMPIYRVR
ncbi:hyaluronate lyase precursor [Photobacterium aphoticum]|uniref:Hyaluronate lyase n=1 Tax=Photobacterium aphoticum TaxID=754436 RepID=A0A090QWC0_9GAMM|nr:hyaluronate lyase precursor [Photobacterium aphoticum]